MKQPVRFNSSRLACGFARGITILVLIAGCSKEPAPAVPPSKPEAPKEISAAAKPGTPQAEEALSASTTVAPAEPTPPAEPVATSPIEDPPVIGTPQEAFNFPRPPLEMPKVLLTEAEQTSSLVKVGDTMPPIELPDMQSAKKTLSSLYGKKLTVVVFWNSRNPYAVEELGDLGPMIAARFGPFGVNVVGINEGDLEAAARNTITSSGARFPNLFDTDGKAFDKVATGELPRTYLLDAAGKILWFDLEYSRSTRRDLKHAVRYVLLHEGQGNR